MTDVDDRDLILRADSMLSYLWYRGFIDKERVDRVETGLRRDIEQLLVDLRIASDNRGNRA